MIKIKSNHTPEELKEIIEELCSANIQEIEFNDIIKIALQLGCTYVDRGSKRKSGAQETFSHRYLKDLPMYHGNFGVHLKHGGGSNRKVYKKNFVNYPAKALLIIAKRLIAEKSSKSSN